MIAPQHSSCAAPIGVHTNERLDAFRDTILALNKAERISSTAAIIVIARKLLRMAFPLYKHQAQFDPGYLKKPA